MNAGQLDPTFGVGGQVITSVTNGSGVGGLVLQPDGKLVASGSSGSNLVLERYNPDGTPDVSFGTGGQVNANIGLSGFVRLALQNDGKLVVSGMTGDFTHNNQAMVVARYLANGTMDAGFGAGGEVTLGEGTLAPGAVPGVQFDELTLQTDGKIVVTRTTSNANSTIEALVVARLNPNGSLDSTFGSNGQASTFISGDPFPEPNGLGIEASGRIVVSTTSELLAFTTGGILDTGFGAGGIARAPAGVTFDGLTIQTDGRVMVVTGTDFAVLRYLANGNIDASFGTTREARTDFNIAQLALAVAVQPDGRYVAAGGEGFADVSSFAVARFDLNGSLDTSYGNGGKATVFPQTFAQSGQILVQPDGRAVAAGTAFGGSFALVRFTADTPLPTANQRFVAQAYLDLLGRPVDSVGLPGWSGMLDHGTSRDQVILGIEASREYATHTVNALYAQYLHRVADGSGLNTFSNFLQSGGTDEGVIGFLVSSPEFLQGQAHGTVDGFLDALYQDGLNRAVDPSGRATWGQALARGASYVQVAAAILASSEYRLNLVTAAYELFLRRQPDLGGLSTFTMALAKGARDEQVFAGIVGSDEYFQRI